MFQLREAEVHLEQPYCKGLHGILVWCLSLLCGSLLSSNSLQARASCSGAVALMPMVRTVRTVLEAHLRANGALHSSALVLH